MTRKLIQNSTVLAALLLANVACAEWPGFLGPGGNPVTSQTLPKTFSVGGESSKTNIAWNVSLDGRSVSGPIVVDGKVITTSSASMEGRWMYVTAVDEKTGEIVWQRSTKSTGRPFCHPTSANAAPTPCTDGEKVYAFFSSNDLVCYDLEGNLQWFKSLTESHPLAGNDVGMSASPVTADGVVVVSVECQADSFTAGVDCETGETLWEVPRPESANWSSPRVAKDADGQAVFLLQGSGKMVAVATRSGEKLWDLEVPCSTVVTSVVSDNKLYIPGGAVRVFDIAKAQSQPEKLWESSRINPNSSSLLVTDYGVIGVNRSVLVCCDNDGERLWNVRLKDAGQIWSTPVIAGEYLYVFSMDGKCFTLKVGSDGAEVVAESTLGTEVLGSPAVSGNALFVRSVDGLWKIAAE